MLLVFVQSDTSIGVLPRPLLVAAGVAALLTMGWTVVLRSTVWGGFAAATTILALQAPSALHALAVAVVSGGVAIIVLWLLRWRGVDVAGDTFTRGGNVLALLLMLVIGVTAIVEGTVQRVAHEFLRTPARQTVTGSFPDIHIVLLDGYPRADVMASLFGDDNQRLLAELEQRGFDVAESSRSSYATTALTLTSMLNMGHLDDLPMEDRSTRRLIQSGRALDIARKHGYTIRANQAPWDNVSLRSADAFCDSGLLTDVEDHLVGGTVVARALRLLVPEVELAARHAAFTERGLDCLRAAPHADETVLSLTHVPLPHLPLAFRRDGSPVPERLAAETPEELTVSFTEFARAYVDQLDHLNAQVLAAVDELIRGPSGRDAVIVIMSDHGPETGIRTWQGGTPIELERHANLFVARTPGQPHLFDESATTVNVFPSIFNAYLGTKLPMQPLTLYTGDIGEFVAHGHPELPR